MSNKLNNQQLEAIHSLTGTLLILAGAGTGKTTVVTQRIHYMLTQGIKAYNILGVTFTNKAATEMRDRLAHLAGKRYDLRPLLLSTFHSLCVQILRRDASLLGYRPGFAICDQSEQLSIIRKVSKTIKSGYVKLSPDELLNKVGNLKNQGLDPQSASRAALEDKEHIIAAVYRRYQEELKRQNSMDFDDLILQTLVLLKNYSESRDFWQQRFQYILVDEFQDTSQVQLELIRILALPQNNLCVVGDDDQSIYSWRGAVATNILNFQENYPNTKVITLEENYRSTNNILNLANAVIKNNTIRKEKNLWSNKGSGDLVNLTTYNDQLEEAERIAAEIKSRLADLSAKDFAILLRTNSQSRALEDEFRAARVPYKIIGGQSFFDRKEVRDVLSYLSVIVERNSDTALLRIINTPARGIGGKSIDSLTNFANIHQCNVLSALKRYEENTDLSPQAKKSCNLFLHQIKKWQDLLTTKNASDLVKTILTDINYEAELQSLYNDPLDLASRWNDALEVGESLSNFINRNSSAFKSLTVSEQINDFLQEAMLWGRADSESKKQKSQHNSVSIITGHSAKGLEFPIVYIIGLEEGLFPHKNSFEENNISEERRLFYVAITRAKKELNLSYCRGRITRGAFSERQPSRFISELPEHLLKKINTRTNFEENKNWLSELNASLFKKSS